MKSDPKKDPRVKDPEILRYLHLVWTQCVLCDEIFPLSLHHVSKHPRDDLRANLVMVCGSGTTGCHGLLEAQDETKKRELGVYILENRMDTIEYLERRKGKRPAKEWMRKYLLIES